MGLFGGLFGKKDEGGGNASGKSAASYAPSVKGEPRRAGGARKAARAWVAELTCYGRLIPKDRRGRGAVW